MPWLSSEVVYCTGGAFVLLKAVCFTFNDLVEPARRAELAELAAGTLSKGTNCAAVTSL